MNEEPLVIPLTIHFRDDEASPSYTTVSSAFAQSQPTCLTSWSLANSHVSPNRSGAAIGCQDGSIYLLRHVPQRRVPTTAPTSPTSIVKSPSMRAPGSNRFHAKFSLRPTPAHSTLASPLPSRPPSPSSITSASSSTAAIQLSNRARAVSALSRMSAQAPKNYVDFDEEEHKLRGMLDRTGYKDAHKEKGPLDVVLPARDITEPDEETKMQIEKLVEEHPHHVRSEPNLLASTLHITATAPSPGPESPHYPSSPTSPVDMSSPSLSGSPTSAGGAKPNLELSQHIFPAGIQNGGSITALLSLPSMHFVSLSSLGDVNVLSTLDGGCVASTTISDASTANGTLRKIWDWRAMDRMRIFEGDVLIIRGCEIPSDEVDRTPATRIVALKLELNDVDAIRIKQVGDWTFDDAFSRVGSFAAEDGTPVVYILKPTSELLLHPLTTAKPLQSTATSAAQSTTHLPLSLPMNLPNPFKIRAPQRSVEGLSEEALHVDDLNIGDPIHVGTLAEKGMAVKGLRVGNRGRGVLWDDFAIEMFQVGFALRKRRRVVLPNVEEAALLDSDNIVVYKKGTLQVARILQDQAKLKDADTTDQVDICRLSILQTVKVQSFNLWMKVEGSSVLCLSTESPTVKLKMVSSTRSSPSAVDEVFNCEGSRESRCGTTRRITCLRPIELGTLTVGFSDGSVGRSSLSDLLFPQRHSVLQRSNQGLNGFITSLHPLPHVSKDGLLVAGADDGGVGIWGLSELDLRARWIMFATPLVRAVAVEGYVGLQSCLICISEDGTVGLVRTCDKIDLLYVIPSGTAPLLKVCLSEDNLVFLYDNGRARLWDAKTREFWRLMDTNKAEELMEQGGWFVIDVRKQSTTYGSLPLRELPPRWISADAGATLLLDIRGLDKFTSRPSAPFHHPPKTRLPGADEEMPLDEDQKAARIPEQLHLVLPLLSVLFTFGLDEQIDAICTNELSVPRQQLAVSWGQNNPVKGFVIPEASDGLNAWQISSAMTTYRLLALITVLRVCLSYEDFERHAAAVIAFYAVALADVVPFFQPPSLDLLTRFWYDSSSDLQQAARTLFGAVLPRMSNEEVINIAEKWQRRLPCLQPDLERDSVVCSRALILAGNIAIEKYALLSTSTLRDISKSLSLYLHDDNCPHSILAIDLCSRGFHIWQNYIDPMDALRSLFHRATDFRKDAPPGAGNQARLAILQVASANTALFVTTISLDILSARIPDHHKSIMLIVAFIVRKRPLVLYPSLPRLVDAVVTSLDPNSTARDSIIQAATVILDQLVMTYPSIAFNQLTQRLAVGTNEGAVIMFDLKTATRLYVLESHRKRVSACSFSPDGRRLVSVSLEESVVMVWKVGSSFSNLFNPGGPPRQGHSGSAPYKTLPFNIGESSDMSVMAQLELITFEWPADRTARLKIRDSTFTFNT